jgi:hypothetical protein
LLVAELEENESLAKHALAFKPHMPISKIPSYCLKELMARIISKWTEEHAFVI